MALKETTFNIFNEKRRQEIMGVGMQLIEDGKRFLNDYNEGLLYLDSAEARVNKMTHTINTLGEELEVYCGPEIFEKIGDYYMTSQNVALHMEFSSRLDKNNKGITLVYHPSNDVLRDEVTSPVNFPSPLALKGDAEEMKLVSKFEQDRVNYATYIDRLDGLYYTNVEKKAQKEALMKQLEDLRHKPIDELDTGEMNSLLKDLEQLNKEIEDSRKEVEDFKNDLSQMTEAQGQTQTPGQEPAATPPVKPKGLGGEINTLNAQLAVLEGMQDGE